MNIEFLSAAAGQAAEQVVGTRGVLASDTVQYLRTSGTPVGVPFALGAGQQFRG